jgi:hypothetical protein
MFAIVPSLAPHRGDMRRDTTPYFVTLGLSYGDLNIANMAMRELNKRGIKCHIEVLDNKGRKI